MTFDEHKSIQAFVERTVGGLQPPMDVEADAIIRALFKLNPDAAYRMTMLAMSLSAPRAEAAPVEAPRPGGWLSALQNRRRPLPVRRDPVISYTEKAVSPKA